MGAKLTGRSGGPARVAVLIVVILVVVGAVALSIWRPTSEDLSDVPVVSAAFDRGVGEPLIEVPGGDPERGPELMQKYGCITCHTVPGVAGANGNVGPPLTDWADRVYIAGLLQNNPDNLISWIQNPQAVVPGNAMPVLGVSDQDARDIAAYLYTLSKN